jgi:putative hydrolase of the HAD superfamily
MKLGRRIEAVVFDLFYTLVHPGTYPGGFGRVGWLARIEADWDLTRRQALFDPPPSAVATLVALRERGIRLGVLSNAHGLELRAWDRSPLAAHVDVVALSYEIGACKPDPATYAYALNRLEVSAAAAAYVGDGSSDELVGARSAGFGMVILAEEAAAKAAPEELPRLRAQADASVTSLTDVVCLVDR